MQALKALFTIEGDTLIAYDNRRYPKIPYTSDLHEQLVYELQDPDYAKVVFNAYEKHISPTLTAEQKVIFEKSLIATALFFGSHDHPPRNALERTLARNGWEGDYPQKLSEFIFATETFFQREKDPAIRRVCILHTTASGGNSAVSRAIDAYLRARNLETHMIDVEEYAKKHDPMQKATGYSYDELYAEILQKKNEPNIQNGFPQFLRERAALNKTIAKYIAPTTLQKVRHAIECISPDLIISTRSYTFEDTQLAYSLNTPLKIVYCDWHLFIHVDQVGKTDPSLVKFWLPKLSSRAFSFLLGKEYNQNDSWQITAEKISRLTRMPTDEVLASFEEIGYPVGEEYVRIDDEGELSHIRKEWQVQNDERVVLVTMGKNGVGILKDLFSQLVDVPKADRPIRYFFIAGTNRELQERLSQKVLANHLTHITVLGHIPHKEMAELMNIASLVVSKPGGGQTVQCLTMGKPMAIPFAHKLWEGGNQHELEQNSLTSPLSQELPLHTQIETMLAPKRPVSLLNWQERISELLHL